MYRQLLLALLPVAPLPAGEYWSSQTVSAPAVAAAACSVRLHVNLPTCLPTFWPLLGQLDVGLHACPALQAEFHGHWRHEDPQGTDGCTEPWQLPLPAPLACVQRLHLRLRLPAEVPAAGRCRRPLTPCSAPWPPSPLPPPCRSGMVSRQRQWCRIGNLATPQAAPPPAPPPPLVAPHLRLRLRLLAP